MPQDFLKRSATFKALSLGDNIGILTGVGDPWDEYSNVPLGSRYFRQNGLEYKKVGLTDLQGSWSIDYPNPAPSFTTVYAYNPATVSNATIIYANVVSITAATIVGVTYLARFSGIAKSPTSQGLTLGYFNGVTEITNNGFRTNHTDTEMPFSLVLPVTATSTSTNIILKLKAKAVGAVCIVRNSLISLEALT